MEKKNSRPGEADESAPGCRLGKPISMIRNLGWALVIYVCGLLDSTSVRNLLAGQNIVTTHGHRAPLDQTVLSHSGGFVKVQMFIVPNSERAFDLNNYTFARDVVDCLTLVLLGNVSLWEHNPRALKARKCGPKYRVRF